MARHRLVVLALTAAVGASACLSEDKPEQDPGYDPPTTKSDAGIDGPDSGVSDQPDAGSTATWRIQTINTRPANEPVSIALDGQDRPRILFEDSEDGIHTQARWTGQTWSYWSDQREGSGTHGDGVGPMALAIDSRDRSHFAVYDTLDQKILSYVLPVGAEVERNFVDFVDLATSMALALGPNDEQHIVVTDYVDSLLYFAQRSGTWQRQTIGDGGGDYERAYDVAIGVAGDGTVHVVYTGGTMVTEAGLRHATLGNGNWAIEAIPLADEEPLGAVAVSLDAQGAPVIAFCARQAESALTPSVRVTKKVGTQWVIEETGVQSGCETLGLALGSDGSPHLAVFGNSGPTYAYRDADGWKSSTISSDSGQTISLALDRDGRPHVAFDVINGVRYATR